MSGDITDDTQWIDSSGNQPPSFYVGPPPYQYQATTTPPSGPYVDLPMTYTGPSSNLSGTMVIPWSYVPGTYDLGAYMNISLNGGGTWTNHQLVASGLGMAVSGTLTVALSGTELLIDVSVGTG